MKAEIKALKQNNTWEIVEIPKETKTIGCKWIYKTKLQADGTLDKYKARSVAKGYNQTEGIDYTETFAAVSRMTTLRTLLSLASTEKWHLHQMDVQNAFLHRDLHEEVYMNIPQCLKITKEPSKNNKIACKLIKSLYGLK